MKRPSASQNGVNTKAFVHHVRHRRKVRTGTCNQLATCAAADIRITERVDNSTTANITYTRRPRKRTDIEVLRLRQSAQQKLCREEKSARNAGAHPRGLRG